MPGEAAELYHSRRLRRLVERRARQEEWDFRASELSPVEVTDGVGRGWHPLVRGFHEQLLVADPTYRLYSVEEALGGLLYVARFEHGAEDGAARLVQEARAQAFVTCELCGREARLRARRPQVKTLCDDCFAADRAAAAVGGERYADAVLGQLMSADDDYPSPEETLAWLDVLDGADA